MTSMVQSSPEIVETMVAEIVNEESFQLDSTMLGARIFGLEAVITEVDAAA
jgi:hypothetical protein